MIETTGKYKREIISDKENNLVYVFRVWFTIDEMFG